MHCFIFLCGGRMLDYKDKRFSVVKRKAIHSFIGLFLFFLYFIINNSEFYVFFLFAVSIGIIIGYSLNLFERIYFIDKMLREMKKKEEVIGEGLLFMISSYIVGALLLDKDLFIVLFWLVSISDGFSSIVGTYYGKKINKHLKSKEGFFAYVVSSLPLFLFFNGNPLVLGLIIISSGFIELLESIEDNLGIAIYLALLKRVVL